MVVEEDVNETVNEVLEEIPDPLMGPYLLDDFQNHRILREKFIVYVGTDPGYEYRKDDTNEIGVEARMADRFEMNMCLLSNLDPKRPILIYLSSCGGSWEEGMQMFSCILTCPNPVTVLVTKWARSMTSIIPLAADRFMMRPPSQYMFHRGSYFIEGLDQEAETYDIERRKCHERMFSIYVERLKERGAYSGWTRKRIRAELDRLSRHKVDVFFDPLEAVRLGFVDDIYEGDLENLRATRRNVARRNLMMRTIKREIKVDIKIS